MPSPLPGFGYLKSTHNYYNLSTGRFVSKAAIRDSLEQMMDLSALRMNALSEKLASGAISLADWQTGMMTQIKSAHVAASALANGGWAQMGAEQWGATGQMIRTQYDYLRNFAREIADGKQSLDGRFMVRTDMYGDAANTTYSAMRTRGFIADGFEEERRVLEARDGNNCDDCIDYAAEGWQPIGTLPEPGDDSQCLKRCRCEKQYRRVTDTGATEESE